MDFQAEEVHTFDPVFNAVDTAALEKLGIRIIQQNEQGNRSIEGKKTLFFMPHCGRRLYENVLRANWTVQALEKLLVLGNPIKIIHQSSKSTRSRTIADSDALQRAAPFLHEFALPSYNDRPEVFSDTSLQYFRIASDDPPTLPDQQNSEFWVTPPVSPSSPDPEVQ